MRRPLSQLLVLVGLHEVQTVHPLDLLVGIDSTQDGANVGLKEEEREGGREGKEQGSEGREKGREGERGKGRVEGVGRG